MHVDKELEAALIQILTSVVHLLTLDKVLEEDVMYKTGQSLHNTLTDTIESSRISAMKHTVGNSMICQVPTNVSMLTTKFSSMNDLKGHP